MNHPNIRRRILIIDSRDQPGVARAFRGKLEQHECEVTIASDNADDTDIIPLLDRQKFDAILFFCSEVYCWEDAQWTIATIDWSILGWKTRSRNAAAPLLAVVTDPDETARRRLRECRVTQVIDRGDRPSAQDIVDRVLRLAAA